MSEFISPAIDEDGGYGISLIERDEVDVDWCQGSGASEADLYGMVTSSSKCSGKLPFSLSKDRFGETGMSREM